MSGIVNKTFISAGVVLCLALSACSSSPTEGELKSAVERKMLADSQALERSVGKQAMPPKPVLQAVRKIACKEDGEKAYRCDVELEVKHGGTLAKGAASMRFLKAGDGWVASN